MLENIRMNENSMMDLRGGDIELSMIIISPPFVFLFRQVRMVEIIG